VKWSGEGTMEWVREREEHCLGLSVVFCRNKKNKFGACGKVTVEQLLFGCEKVYTSRAMVTFVVVRAY
jgi:hypothetical protein